MPSWKSDSSQSPVAIRLISSASISSVSPEISWLIFRASFSPSHTYRTFPSMSHREMRGDANIKSYHYDNVQRFAPSGFIWPLISSIVNATL